VTLQRCSARSSHDYDTHQEHVGDVERPPQLHLGLRVLQYYHGALQILDIAGRCVQGVLYLVRDVARHLARLYRLPLVRIVEEHRQRRRGPVEVRRVNAERGGEQQARPSAVVETRERLTAH
jgi:hypothetical protein